MFFNISKAILKFLTVTVLTAKLNLKTLTAKVFKASNNRTLNKNVNGNWLSLRGDGSYNPFRLVKLPSSSGMGPENWFASTPLKISSHHRNIIQESQYIQCREQFDTYRILRFLKFCKPDGKRPDKRFAQSELRENSKITRKTSRRFFLTSSRI